MTEKTEGLSGVAKRVKVDSHFRHEILMEAGGETLRLCYQCGTCTSSCPVSRFSDSYRPRTILKMTELGMRNETLSDASLWLCAACFTCTDRCPQNVDVASVIRVLKNLAVGKAPMPSVLKELASNVLEKGYAYEISELRQRKRVEAGLPPLPKANLESIKSFAGASGLSKMIGTKREAQNDST